MQCPTLDARFPAVVWEGFVKTKRGEGRYRVVLLQHPDNPLFNRHHVRVERHYWDATEEAGWVHCGDNPPRELFATILRDLVNRSMLRY